MFVIRTSKKADEERLFFFFPADSKGVTFAGRIGDGKD